MSVKLKGGSAAATYLVDGNPKTVRKDVSLTDPNGYKHLRDQYAWMKYHSAEHPLFFPRIFEDQYDGNVYSYSMEYLEGKSGNEYFLEQPEYVSEFLRDAIERIADHGFVDDFGPFQRYIDRCKQHIANLNSKPLFRKLQNANHLRIAENNTVENIRNIDFFKFFQVLDEVAPKMNKHTSNCHGDFTLENVIFGENGGMIIDSNFLFSNWNSWLLDVSKVFQSIHFDYEETFAPTTRSEFDEKSSTLSIDYDGSKGDLFRVFVEDYMPEHQELAHILEVTHYIRMLPYKLKISEEDFIKAYFRLCQCYTHLEY